MMYNCDRIRLTTNGGLGFYKSWRAHCNTTNNGAQTIVAFSFLRVAMNTILYDCICNE